MSFLHGVKILEIDAGARPIQSASSSVIGLVGVSVGDGTAATCTLGNILLTRKTSGASSLAVVVTTSGNNTAAAVTVSGNTVTIANATGSTGIATSIQSGIVALINANSALAFTAALVSSALSATVMTTFASTPFVGGTSATTELDTPFLVTSLTNLIGGKTLDVVVGGANSYLYKALVAIFAQTSAVVIVSRTANVAGNGINTGVYALKSCQANLGLSPRIVLCQGAQDASNIAPIKAVLDSLRAVSFITISAESSTLALTWANTNTDTAGRTMSIWPTVNGGEDAAPYFAGALAKADNELGFWWSPSNKSINGITKLDYPVDFAFQDAGSTANVLNNAKISTIIQKDGFRTWGNLTGFTTDGKYQFLSVRRTADIINDSILTAHLWAVDRNITKTYLQDVTESVNTYLKYLTNIGAIIGGKCWPDPDLNTPDQIAQGNVYFNFDFTPPYPAQSVVFRSILTNSYLSELI